MKKIIPWLLVPSGCAALIYQVVWVRLLMLSMGATSASVSTVLTAFFLGMGVGSFISTKSAWFKHHGLLVFFFIELMIAVSGLLSLPTFLHLDEGMSLLGEAGAFLSVKFIVSIAVLVVPTVCMGITLPLMVFILANHKPVEMDRAADDQLGKLYALNTFGAVLGAVLSGFILIPSFGLDGSLYVACSLNMVAALSALWLFFQKIEASNFEQVWVPQSVESFHQPKTLLKQDKRFLLLSTQVVIFGTGFLAIASEVGWTKYLSIYIGATIYGFSAILAIFLAGIAIGSWCIQKNIPTFMEGGRNLFIGLMVLAASLLLAKVGLAQLPMFLNTISGVKNYQQFFKYLSVFILLFPATFILGALFPIMLSRYCALRGELSKTVGSGYVINTVGSILGSLVAGFWVIPSFGTDVLLAAMVVFAILLAWLFVAKTVKFFVVAASCSTVLLAMMMLLPSLNYKSLITANPYRFDARALSGEKPKFLFLEEGKAGVISMIAYDEHAVILQNNGIQESYIPMSSKMSPPFTEVLLGLMPYFLHTDPASALVIGYGGGNTIQALLNSPLEKVTVVELEPAVIRAVAAVSNQPLFNDSRLQIKLNDARNTLLIEQKQYDFIISQPSHPWLSGAGNLFTQEFFDIAASRLKSGGVFTQWVNLFNMDATTLRSILQAFYATFPYGFVFQNVVAGDLVLFGSMQPLVFDTNRTSQRMQQPSIQTMLAVEGLSQPTDLLWYFSLSRQEALQVAAGVEPNTDTLIFSEVRLAGLSADPSGDESPYNLLNKYSTFDVLPYLKSQKVSNELYLLGTYLYQYQDIKRTHQVIAQLKTVDPDLAEKLEQELKTWQATQG